MMNGCSDEMPGLNRHSAAEVVHILAQEQWLFDPISPFADAIPVIYAFPNSYSVGITSLGFQVVYGLLRQQPGLEVSRLFLDLAEPLPRQPKLVGFSFSWELDYGNILQLLDYLEIPIWSHDRQDQHPLVFGGGPVLTANPEPYADFFDLILLGDGEELLQNFIQALHTVKEAPRQEQLLTLAQVPGVYVPSLYQVSYQSETGPIQAITPKYPEVPAQVVKQTYRGNTLAASAIVTPHAAWENIYLVEVVRSCPELCRFCLASYLTLPFRTPGLEQLIPVIEKGLTVTNRIGLLGASVTQHPEFEALLDYLGQPQFDQVRLSIASVRTNTVTEKLAQTLAKRDTRSLTIAIESGSSRLRAIVNKKLEQAEILQAAQQAQAGGLKGIKFYGMVGIPGETDADVQATLALMQQLKKATPGFRFTLGCSTFVPKAHTPFQWLGVNPQAEKRLQQLQKGLGKIGLEFRPESYQWSVVQALLSRGDRRLAKVLERTRHYGDSLGSYKRAFKDFGAEVGAWEDYIFADWQLERVLPWQHLQGPLPLDTLVSHLTTAQALINSPDTA